MLPLGIYLSYERESRWNGALPVGPSGALHRRQETGMSKFRRTNSRWLVAIGSVALATTLAACHSQASPGAAAAAPAPGSAAKSANK